MDDTHHFSVHHKFNESLRNTYRNLASTSNNQRFFGECSKCQKSFDEKALQMPRSRNFKSEALLTKTAEDYWIVTIITWMSNHLPNRKVHTNRNHKWTGTISENGINKVKQLQCRTKSIWKSLLKQCIWKWKFTYQWKGFTKRKIYNWTNEYFSFSSVKVASKNRNSLKPYWVRRQSFSFEVCWNVTTMNVETITKSIAYTHPKPYQRITYTMRINFNAGSKFIPMLHWNVGECLRNLQS